MTPDTVTRRVRASGYVPISPLTWIVSSIIIGAIAGIVLGYFVCARNPFTGGLIPPDELLQASGLEAFLLSGIRQQILMFGAIGIAVGAIVGAATLSLGTR